jgi:predicted transposase YdaD
METDSFFWQLLKQLPETIFALLGLPVPKPGVYRFEAVEIKNPQYRLDGLFIPRRRSLPLYFVDVQFQRNPNFYANLFAKVTSYINQNDPAQGFMAVAIFQDRTMEPADCKNLQHWINSPNVRRIYLDELSIPGPPKLLYLKSNL